MPPTLPNGMPVPFPPPGGLPFPPPGGPGALPFPPPGGFPAGMPFPPPGGPGGLPFPPPPGGFPAGMPPLPPNFQFPAGGIPPPGGFPGFPPPQQGGGFPPPQGGGSQGPPDHQRGGDQRDARLQGRDAFSDRSQLRFNCPTPPNMSYFTFAELPMGSDRDTQIATRRSFHSDEFDRPCRRFLQRLSQRDEKWGFTIYRTVYTPESDSLFLSALEKIKACFATALRYELRSNYERRAYATATGDPPPLLISPGPCNQVEDQYNPLVIDDRKVWDGASIEDVRAHFRDAIFLESLRMGYIEFGPQKEHTMPYTPLAQDPKSSICLVIDAEALSLIANTELLDRGMYSLMKEEIGATLNDLTVGLKMRALKQGQHGFVKGVDADWPRHSDIWGSDENEPSMLGARNGIPDPPRRLSQYQGWRPVGCEKLWALYNDECRDGGRLGEIENFFE
ncbi:hypothetical protein V502_05135 [Pseudogymnoascus sp. VKM F-4520 (FW-2644)]|nr:hypothetical protein V502_05135 [Pseudogymnoascus sp. VKM F-4520 (FW-2644)]